MVQRRALPRTRSPPQVPLRPVPAGVPSRPRPADGPGTSWAPLALSRDRVVVITWLPKPRPSACSGGCLARPACHHGAPRRGPGVGDGHCGRGSAGLPQLRHDALRHALCVPAAVAAGLVRELGTISLPPCLPRQARRAEQHALVGFRRRKYHMMHHGQGNDNSRFGITTTFFDILFGTYPKAS